MRTVRSAFIFPYRLHIPYLHTFPIPAFLIPLSMIERFLEYMRLERNRSELTAVAYGRDLRLFSEFLKESCREKDIAEASLTDIRAWLSSQAAAGNAPRSLRRKAQSLRSFFRWLNTIGLRNDNPAARLTLAKADKPLPAFVEAEEMEDVINGPLSSDPYLDARNRMIVEMLYGCGLRQAELRAIRDSDISMDRSELRVHGKGGKLRVIPLAEKQKEKINEWRRLRDGMASDRGERTQGYLIPGRGGAAISPSRLYAIVREALAGTGTHRRSPHTLRHTFATAMLTGGADIVTVKEFLGHSSLESTQIYTHLNFRQLQSSYRSAHPRARETEPEDEADRGTEPEKSE